MSGMSLDTVRDGLQKLFDAGPGVACNAFPLAQWIECLDAHLARDTVKVSDSHVADAHLAYHDFLELNPDNDFGAMRTALEEFAETVKVSDEDVSNALYAWFDMQHEANGSTHGDCMRAALESFADTLTVVAKVPCGWKIVPVNPTSEMKECGSNIHRELPVIGLIFPSLSWVSDIYKAMVGASLNPPLATDRKVSPMEGTKNGMQSDGGMIDRSDK